MVAMLRAGGLSGRDETETDAYLRISAMRYKSCARTSGATRCSASCAAMRIARGAGGGRRPTGHPAAALTGWHVKRSACRPFPRRGDRYANAHEPNPHILFGAAAGAAAAHFLDPDQRATAGARSTARQHVDATAAWAGAVQARWRRQGEGRRDAVTRRRKASRTRTTSRSPARSRQRSSARPTRRRARSTSNVQNGVVYLRGEVDTTRRSTEPPPRPRNVDGIKGVESLLHLPARPAPAAEPRGLVQERAENPCVS